MIKMLCRIADLIAEVPAAGGLAPRCEAYLCEDEQIPQIIIREDKYRKYKFAPSVSEDMIAYMESAAQFYIQLLRYDGFYLHSSAVMVDDKVYLFSGHSGAGKSTHTQLWQQRFGKDARIINDDKPAIRYVCGKWIAYGTPWCGKDGINENLCAPVAGVCFLNKADHNAIRRLPSQEAMQKILAQTIHRFDKLENLDLLLMLLDRFLAEVPVYELENRPEAEAAQLSYETMCKGAEEMG